MLKIFGFINCSMITQKSLLEIFKRRNKVLVAAEDGRCDSPGHCAKYGSYLLVEQT